MEKSDLKYPLIHGQVGRSVNVTPKNPLDRPCRGGSSFVPHGGPWLRSGCFKVTGMFPQPRGPWVTVHLCVLYMYISGLSAITSHLCYFQARLLGTLAVSGV